MNLSELLGNYPVASVALLTAATIGSVELVRRLFKKDWEAVVVILVSAFLPALLAGMVDGITPLVGAVIGLAASGVITTATRV